MKKHERTKRLAAKLKKRNRIEYHKNSIKEAQGLLKVAKQER